jgi:hypothetical protein
MEENPLCNEDRIEEHFSLNAGKKGVEMNFKKKYTENQITEC